MVHECAEPDCVVLTMGELCLEHELEVRAVAESALFAAMAEVDELEEHPRLYVIHDRG
jgi:hypothetical protein